MALKKLKPITPGQRFAIRANFEGLAPNKPERSLVVPKKRTGGRNNQGRMTVEHRGGGHKRKLRLIDWKRRIFDVPAQVKSIEYDPNRSARIALLYYKDGRKTYIVAPLGLEVGSFVVAGKEVPPEIGNALPLQNMPVGTIVHNIELSPGRGASIVRSAGTSAQVMGKKDGYVTIKLPSRQRRRVLGTCMATVGVVSNGEHNKEKLGKAGRNRWLGNRPNTRGVAKNPVDHPMGGGSGGKASGGHPRSKNGLIAKGKKTRKKNKHSNKYIISNR